MGHVNLAYVQDLCPDLTTAVRYRFNYYSLHSSIDFGTEWRSNGNGILKASLGTDNGFQLMLDTRVRNMIFTMGLSINKPD
ncbi:hypothetical protein EV182_008726, partial [Spiromyces aspiralis]